MLFFAQGVLGAASAVLMVKTKPPLRSNAKPILRKLFFVLAIATVCFCVGKVLVDLRSNYVALACHELANSLFFVAMVGAVIRKKTRRIFWIFVALAIWSYIGFLWLWIRPFLGLPGILWYLQTFHPSVDSSYVTANSIFAIPYSLACGLAFEMIAFAALRKWHRRKANRFHGKGSYQRS